MTNSVEQRPMRSGAEPSPHTTRGRKHWLLLLIPYLWCIAAIPLVNQIGYIFGNVPFLLVWMIAGVLLSSACVTTVFVIDRRNGDLERI